MEQCLLGQTYSSQDGIYLRQGFTFMLAIREFIVTRHPEYVKSISEIRGKIKKGHSGSISMNGCRFAMSVLGIPLQLDIVRHFCGTEMTVEWQSHPVWQLVRASSDTRDVRLQMDKYVIMHKEIQKKKLYFLKACDVQNIDEDLRRHIIDIACVDLKPEKTLESSFAVFQPKAVLLWRTA